MNIALSLWQEPDKLIDAIWQARSGDRRDVFNDVARLLDHENPTVREEAVSLLFVQWRDASLRERLANLARFDPDFGVRSRAAGALGLSSTPESKRRDIELLRDIVLVSRSRR